MRKEKKNFCRRKTLAYCKLVGFFTFNKSQQIFHFTISTFFVVLLWYNPLKKGGQKEITGSWSNRDGKVSASSYRSLPLDESRKIEKAFKQVKYFFTLVDVWQCESVRKSKICLILLWRIALNKTACNCRASLNLPTHLIVFMQQHRMFVSIRETFCQHWSFFTLQLVTWDMKWWREWNIQWTNERTSERANVWRSGKQRVRIKGSLKPRLSERTVPREREANLEWTLFGLW